MTLLIYDDIFLQHDTGYGHPENAKRLENTVKYLRSSGLWDQLRVERPRAASLEEVKLVHPHTYIETIKQIADTGGGWLDGDTVVSRESYNAAVHAAGAPLTAIDLIMKGEEKNGFCLVRPPGHHATPSRGMGFCLFNNVAIAAKYLQSKYQLEKFLLLIGMSTTGMAHRMRFTTTQRFCISQCTDTRFIPVQGERRRTARVKARGSTSMCPSRLIRCLKDILKYLRMLWNRG